MAKLMKTSQIKIQEKEEFWPNCNRKMKVPERLPFLKVKSDGLDRLYGI
jgi:hypothetical protein